MDPMTILIYGANGYTGRLCAAEARARGIEAILAGRSRAKLEPVAKALGLEMAVADLEESDKLVELVSRTKAVLHIAGPFAVTATPMVEACLQAGVHYCDITGEVRVLEALRSYDARARERGIVLLPGSGFDVVPSDCLIAYVAGRATNPTALSLAIDWSGGASRGTARTGASMIGGGVLARRAGVLVTQPNPAVRDFDFGDGPVRCIASTWGDLSTAFASTGIGNITTYFSQRSGPGRLSSVPAPIKRLAGTLVGRALIQFAVDRLPDGPSLSDLQTRFARLVAVAEGGPIPASACLTVPHPYALTARTAVDIARRAALGELEPGYQTPSGALGVDYITEFDGVNRLNLEYPS